MGMKETKFITISCNGPNCPNSVTFQATEVEHKAAVAKTGWMEQFRNVVTFDGRQFGYCSDTCEVNSITEGNHGRQEQKKVVAIDSNAEFQMRMAAEAARKSEEATKNLKEGNPVTLHTS